MTELLTPREVIAHAVNTAIVAKNTPNLDSSAHTNAIISIVNALAQNPREIDVFVRTVTPSSKK